MEFRNENKIQVESDRMAEDKNKQESDTQALKILFKEVFKCDGCLEKYLSMVQDRLNNKQTTLEECFGFPETNFEEINFLKNIQKKFEVKQR